MYVNIPKIKDHPEVVIIDKRDGADAYYNIASVVLPLLRQFQEALSAGQVYGIPTELVGELEPCFDDQECFAFIDRDAEYGRSVDRASARWKEMLDAMVYSFERVYDDPLLMNPPDHTSVDSFRDYGERVQRGLTLFGEHFFSLAW